MEDRIKSCYNWKIPCLHQIDRSSLEMKLVHEPINEFIYNRFLINEFVLQMNSLIIIERINEFIYNRFVINEFI
jgi:hypothetical protein